MKPLIYPSLIAANLLNLQHVITSLETHCDGYHIDIMDGHFVPNLTWGPDFANAIAKITKKVIWVHLMTTDNLRWINQLQLPTGSLISFHIEDCKNSAEVIAAIKAKKWLASIAVKPQTDIVVILPLLTTIDHVLVMSVEPGFSGQSFIPHTLTKVTKLIEERTRRNLTFKIGMDGGINHNNYQEIVKNGVTDLAIASAIFAHKDPVEVLKKFLI